VIAPSRVMWTMPTVASPSTLMVPLLKVSACPANRRATFGGSGVGGAVTIGVAAGPTTATGGLTDGVDWHAPSTRVATIASTPERPLNMAPDLLLSRPTASPRPSPPQGASGTLVPDHCHMAPPRVN